MSKNYKQIAENVVKKIGGEKNVSHLEHCSTRLRFSIVDPSKVDKEGLKKTSGVMGVVGSGNQCQVVIGNDVIEVYDEVMKLGNFNNQAASVVSTSEKAGIGSIILDFMVGVFQPLVPAIAGAGILKAFLSLFVMIGIMSNTSPWYTLLYNAADAALYFLPIMVAVTMSTKIGCNRLVAVSIVGSLILPSITTAVTEGLTLLGFTVQNIQYSYQVFPAILCVALLYFVEKYVTKFTPKPIRVFFVPMVCILIVVPITFLILGPLGYNIGQLMTSFIVWNYGMFGWIAVALLAAILPFMIATGMHKAFVPYAVASITESGEELLYLPASLAHNIAESGACFAVAVKTKDTDLRSTAFSAGISALFGITEPALYGVTLQHRKALYGVIVGSFVGGLTVGITAVKGFVAMGPGLAGMAMFVDEANSMNIVWAFVGLVISLLVAFVATLFLYKDVQQEVIESSETIQTEDFAAPVDGECIPLSEVEDEVFSSGIMGQGVAFKFEGDTIYAPCDGEIMMIAATKHAIGFKTNTGAEVLIHVGMDTVKLNGEGFTVLKQTGDKVSKGEAVMKIDRAFMEKQNIDLTTPMVITNGQNQKIETAGDGKVQAGKIVLTLG